MPKRRLNWRYDDDKQEFLTPCGRRISLHEIAGMLHDLAECRVDLQGPWAGWRIRGAALIPPRGSIRGAHLKPHNLAAFLRWRASPAPTLATRDPRVPGLDDSHTVPFLDRQQMPAYAIGPAMVDSVDRLGQIPAMVVIGQADVRERRLERPASTDLGPSRIQIVR